MKVLFNILIISLAALVCVQGSVPSVPPHTSFLEDTLQASMVIRDHLSHTKPQSPEFLKICLAVIDLLEKMEIMGQDAYPRIYLETVSKALKEADESPIDAYNKVRNHIQNTMEELKKIIAFLIHKQVTECTVPKSPDCDSIIESGLINDPFMRRRADLLAASAKQAKVFLDLMKRFEIATANELYNTESFLITNFNKMKSLVMAAHETLKVLNSLKL